MAMLINNLMVDEGPSIFYNQKFRSVLETHLSYLRTPPRSDYLEIETFAAHKYEHDFYGLLNFYKVDPQLHWLTLRLNEMTSPTEYSSDIASILIPSINEVNAILRVFKTSNKEV